MRRSVRNWCAKWGAGRGTLHGISWSKSADSVLDFPSNFDPKYVEIWSQICTKWNKIDTLREFEYFREKSWKKEPNPFLKVPFWLPFWAPKSLQIAQNRCQKVDKKSTALQSRPEHQKASQNGTNMGVKSSKFWKTQFCENRAGAYTGAWFSRVRAPQNESKNGRKTGFEKKTWKTASLIDFGAPLGGPWDKYFVFFGGQNSNETLRGFLRGFFGTPRGWRCLLYTSPSPRDA